MDRRFLAAFTDPAPVRMLGRVVYPFCLKHRVRLMAVDSPLLKQGEIKPSDLLLAVKICAEEPLGGLSLSDRWHLLRMSTNRTSFLFNVSRFVEYVQVSSWPKFWEKEGKNSGDAGGTMPWPLTVISSLIASGIPEQRAWEMPECQAVWMSCAFAKHKGVDLNILSTEEEEFMESVRLASPPEVKTNDEPRDGIPAEGQERRPGGD